MRSRWKIVEVCNPCNVFKIKGTYVNVTYFLCKSCMFSVLYNFSLDFLLMILRDTLPKRRDLRYRRKESTYHHFVIKMCFASHFLLIFKANFDVCYCERRPLLLLFLQLSRLEFSRFPFGTFFLLVCSRYFIPSGSESCFKPFQDQT
jgi:hypothetical protein